MKAGTDPEPSIAPPTARQPHNGHPWRALANVPTCWSVGTQHYHESLLRSYRVLERVRLMLTRGDSNETIREFIDYMGAAPEPPMYECKLVPTFYGVDWARGEAERK